MANREVGISSVVELGEILRAVRKESGLTQRDALYAMQRQFAIS